VSRPADAARIVDACRQVGPLRGLVHAAGVLDDGTLANQAPERFARVMGPKAHGAWHLHELTRDAPPDFFVCFSSMASLLGSPGQGNYAAANAFLDGLMHCRRALGLPGLSINWGPWAEAGMAAPLAARLEAHGEFLLDPAVALRAFTRALGLGAPQVAVMRVDWARYAAGYPVPEFLSLLHAATPAAPALRQRLEEAPPGRRRELLADFVRSMVARVLGHPPEAVPTDRGFADLGLDSLGAIELRAQAERALQLPLPATLAFDHPTVDALAAHLAGLLQPAPEAPGLDGLTRDEIAALLAHELAADEGGQP
jgi:acyl carrier protein